MSIILVFRESSLLSPEVGLVLKVIMVMDVLILVLLHTASSVLQVKLRKRARRNLKSCQHISEEDECDYKKVDYHIDDNIAGRIDPEHEMVEVGQELSPGGPVQHLPVVQHLNTGVRLGGTKQLFESHS